MNAPLRRVGVVVLVLFGLLFVNLNWVQAYKANAYRTDPHNSRVQLSEYQRQRGQIAVSGGQVIVAQSAATGDELKFQRSYPLGAEFAPFVGYKPVNGLATGVEQAENDFLSGNAPELFADRIKEMFGNKSSGGNILLTVNKKIQDEAYNDLLHNRSGAKDAAAVVLDPTTGAVLAMASTPSYDPGPLVSHDTDAAANAYQQLANDPDKPLLNKATQETFSPGSTMKVIVSAAALSTGQYNPQTMIPAGSSYTPIQGGSFTMHNAEASTCPQQTVTLIQALTVSCNTAFAQLGVKLGSQQLTSMAKAFGFEDDGLSLGRDGHTAGLGVAASHTGDLTDANGNDDPNYVAQSSIGQLNVQMTPMLGAMIAATVANGGRQMRPYIVDKAQAPDLSSAYTASPKVLRTPVTEQVAGELQGMMESVVRSGTGTRAQIDGFQVGGKTGTAQNATDSGDHGWFIGFVMKNNQPIAATAVFLEHAGAGGSGEAARIAGDLMRTVIAERGSDEPGGSDDMVTAGVKLGGRYRLDDRIAGGGMGEVWRGTDEVLGRTVAVKILLPGLLQDAGFVERFRGEARTMATIKHPGVVDIYDYGSDPVAGAYLVMEYVEGEALSSTLGKVGRLTPARTMALVAQAADALQAAHDKGIVHRDVKPGNLLVRPDGTLVLTDFGIARSDLVGNLTTVGSVLGTASYISPEQAEGAVATPLSDVYALGVVAYQCLAGRRPFEGDNPLEIAMKHVRTPPPPLPPDIPPTVRVIVERAMAKPPAARYPSAAALGQVARRSAGGAGGMATGAGPTRPFAGYPAGGAVTRPVGTRPGGATAATRVGPVAGVSPVSPVAAGAAAPTSPAASTRPVAAGYARGAAAPPPPQRTVPDYREATPRPEKAAPAGERSRAVLTGVLVGLVALLLIGAGITAYVITSQRDGGNSASGQVTDSPTATTQGPSAPAQAAGPPSPTDDPTITIACNRYKGKQYNDVEQALSDQGFTVDPVREDGGKSGRVVDISPCQGKAGDHITVTFETGKGDGGSDGDQSGSGSGPGGSGPGSGGGGSGSDPSPSASDLCTTSPSDGACSGTSQSG